LKKPHTTICAKQTSMKKSIVIMHSVWSQWKIFWQKHFLVNEIIYSLQKTLNNLKLKQRVMHLAKHEKVTQSLVVAL